MSAPTSPEDIPQIVRDWIGDEDIKPYWDDAGKERVLLSLMRHLDLFGVSLVVDGQARINGQIVSFEVGCDSRLDGEHLHLSIAGDQEVQG